MVTVFYFKTPPGLSSASNFRTGNYETYQSGGNLDAINTSYQYVSGPTDSYNSNSAYSTVVGSDVDVAGSGAYSTSNLGYAVVDSGNSEDFASNNYESSSVSYGTSGGYGALESSFSGLNFENSANGLTADGGSSYQTYSSQQTYSQ